MLTHKQVGRRIVCLSSAVVMATMSLASWAQLAPTGSNYAARASDTGFLGEVNSSGGYGASVPLELPPARDGLPLPVDITYGEHGVGAAGLGWSVPLSFIRLEHTFAGRRPVDAAFDVPHPRDRLTLTLLGSTVELVLSAGDGSGNGDAYVARNGASDLKVVQQDANTWLVYDGNGRAYLFTNSYNVAALQGAGTWLLSSIDGKGGNNVALDYSVTTPAYYGVTTTTLAIDLTQVSYNPHPTTDNCYKNAVSLTYNPETSSGSIYFPNEHALLSLSMIGSRAMIRQHTLNSVNVTSRATCADTATTLRSYQLSYLSGGDPDTKLPRLQSVTMTGQAGTSEASVTLPIANYAYGTATNAGALNYALASSSSTTLKGLSGIPLNNPPLPAEPGGSPNYFTVDNFIDYTGDGRVDPLGPSTLPGFAATTVCIPTCGKAEEARSLTGARFSPSGNTEKLFRQAIDFNGDGRVDIIDAVEQGHRWVVYLNTPDPTNPATIVWKRELISIDSVASFLGEGTFLPLSKRITTPASSISTEVTRTVWRLQDVNGDGYPDLIAIDASTQAVLVAYNILGAHLAFDSTNAADLEPFSSPVVLDGRNAGQCGTGLEVWDSTDQAEGVQRQLCDIVDVNGDGIADRAVGAMVLLGTGDPASGGFMPSDITLPGPPVLQESGEKATCVGTNAGNASATFTVTQTAGLRDVTGDHIPDYVKKNTDGTWSVFVGTGVGFAPAIPLTVTGDSFALSSSIENCAGQSSVTGSGLADIDSDGKPEVFKPDAVHGGDKLYSVLGSGGVLGAPEAGRLVQQDNGYGAQTAITYRSAKADTTTLHQVPFPEIVVSSVKTTGTKDLGGTLAETRYAYGDAEQFFDPIADRFVFPGYREKVALVVPNSSTEKGSASVTTTYSLPLATSGMTINQRFGRYLRVGRVRDQMTLTDRAAFTDHPNGNPLGTDPYALLAAFRSYTSAFSADNRVISSKHYDWDTRYFTTATAIPSGNEFNFNWDMVQQYNFMASRGYDLSQGSDAQHANYDVNKAYGFVFESSVQTDTGDSLVANAIVTSRSEVRGIDDTGRVTSAASLNDFNRSDDDICIATVYAVPTGTTDRVLHAPASVTVTDCASTPKVLSKDIVTYDGLAVGSVSAGLVTGHDVERHDESGALLSTIHKFNATFNSSANPSTVTTTREDTASRTITTSYDAFQLASVSAQIDATNGDGTTLPRQTTTVTLDPLTLNVLSVQEPNGAKTGATYDGFGRVLLSTVTPVGGTEGALSSTTYNGFALGSSGGRSIVQKVFTDAVPDANVGTAAGRTSTVYLDELARARKTAVNLGADYSNKLIAVQRTYDGLGRVLFEADPFEPTNPPPAGSDPKFTGAYGTTQYFNGDGTVSCVIRGTGVQPITVTTTNETSEVYPSCSSLTYQNHTMVASARDAASLSTSSPQAGVVNSITLTAIGRKIDSSTTQGGTRNEYATFAYDRLGHLTGMTRYQDAVTPANPITTSWHYDSVDWLLELDEPDSAAQFRTYTNWGELADVRWCDPAVTTCPTVAVPQTFNRRSLTQYDALGRVTHREDRKNDDVVMPETVADYAYDTPATFVSRVTPTNVLGRLASATWSTGRVSLSYDGLGRLNAQGYDDLHGVNEIEKHTTNDDGSPQDLRLQLSDNSFQDERVDYTYDSAGRVRSVKYNDGSNQDLFTAPNVGDLDVFGRIRRAHYGLASFTASYADAGRNLLNQVTASSPAPMSTSRQILLSGLSGLTSERPDPLGRERQRVEYTNGASGTNGLITASQYNALGQLSSATKTTGGTNTIQSDRSMTYDALGNVLSQTDNMTGHAGSVALSYQTTDRDRLCSVAYGGASPNPTCDVKYDGVGNIVEQLARTGRKRKFTYLPNGRIQTITDGTNAAGDNANSATFNYDAFGGVDSLTLTSTTSTDTRHDKHFGGLISRHDEAGASVLTRTIPAPGLVATRHGAHGKWTFEFGEPRGTRFVTDESGAFVQDMDYQPYGEIIAATGNLIDLQPGSSLYTNDQWNGGDALAAFGLSRLGARIYDPVVGRFLSRDPLLIPRTSATTNPYAFANNDPVNNSDPSGLVAAEGGPGHVPEQPGISDAEFAASVAYFGWFTGSAEGFGQSFGTVFGGPHRDRPLSSRSGKAVGGGFGGAGTSLPFLYERQSAAGSTSSGSEQKPTENQYIKHGWFGKPNKGPPLIIKYLAVSAPTLNQYLSKLIGDPIGDLQGSLEAGVYDTYGIPRAGTEQLKEDAREANRAAASTFLSDGFQIALLAATLGSSVETEGVEFAGVRLLGQDGFTYGYGFEQGEHAALLGRELVLGKFPGNIQYVFRNPGTATVDVPWGWTPNYNAGYVRGFLESGGKIRFTSQNFSGTFGLEARQVLGIPGATE